MAHLSIRVLGPFQISLDKDRVTGFPSDKVRALLVYLAMTPGRPHRRETLAGLLWPDFTERSARTNLRNALAKLRSVLGEHAADPCGEGSPPFLESTRQTVQFNSAGDVWVDALAFQALVGGPMPAREVLEQAVSLVRGPFLEGFTLADAAPFEEWLLLQREHLGRQTVDALDGLAVIYEALGHWEEALALARRRVELEPWQEEGQRLLMRLLANSGHRTEAIAQFEAHRRVLAEELGVEPAPETTEVCEQIRKGELVPRPAAPTLVPELVSAARLPGFLEQDAAAPRPPVFVARERQLGWLDGKLDRALAGSGQVVFVTGGPGRGKTALLAEFGRRAMEIHADLLVASGNCNAYSGVGDPYLPFRDILGLLTGDVEARWAAGSIGRDHARRLWAALPLTVQLLVDHGPHLVPTVVPGPPLLSRVRAAMPAGSRALRRLADRVERRVVPSAALEQSHLFQEVTHLLRALAEEHPLLLILDDLQWADTASTGLLFHLGRRLEGARILIAGAYRPVELALGRGGVRHPLEKVLSEFKRTYGDVWLDLVEVEEPERRRFVDALVDTEPNRLGEGFCRVLTEHTGGHPLFTVELLRAMQARGDLVHDQAGRWAQGPVLDWKQLPARVEGVIEERVGRLEPRLREILSVAAVEGEAFTVQVVAQVLGMEEGQLLRRLAQDLERGHRLVAELAEARAGPRQSYQFRFGHVLVQYYLYQQLSRGERRLLHGQVAAALEGCYGDRADDFAVQLAHHHDRAGDDLRALHYFTRAAENAQRAYANEDAYTHYTRAMEAAGRVSVDVRRVIRPYLGRGLVSQTLGDFEGALADYETALQLAEDTSEPAVEHLGWQALVSLGRLWTSRDYHRAHDCLRDALELAQRIGDPTLRAGSLNWIGNWHSNAEDPGAAVTHHQEALAIFEELGDRPGLATTLDLLGIASLLGGDMTACVGYYDRAISLFRELGDLPSLALSLTGRGHSACWPQTARTLAPPNAANQARRDFDEAARITREIGSPADEAWVLWSESLLCAVQGRYGRALEAGHGSLGIATQIQHREGMAASQIALGMLYTELLAPEKARRHLEAALTLAEELHNRVVIRWATGALSAAYCLLDDLARAQACLETALSAETPMDTLYRRHCWASRAQLALCQGNPALALDIVERLIASGPGLAPGRVIAFLWKLRGEALALMGQREEACSLLRAATETAQATGERCLLWRLRATLALLYAGTGRDSEAEGEFSAARRLIEGLADTLPRGEVRDSFLKRAHERLRSLS